MYLKINTTSWGCALQVSPIFCALLNLQTDALLVALPLPFPKKNTRHFKTNTCIFQALGKWERRARGAPLLLALMPNHVIPSPLNTSQLSHVPSPCRMQTGSSGHFVLATSKQTPAFPGPWRMGTTSWGYTSQTSLTSYALGPQWMWRLPQERRPPTWWVFRYWYAACKLVSRCQVTERYVLGWPEPCIYVVKWQKGMFWLARTMYLRCNVTERYVLGWPEPCIYVVKWQNGMFWVGQNHLYT